MEYRVVQVTPDMYDEVFKLTEANCWELSYERTKILLTADPQGSFCAVDDKKNILGHVFAARISKKLTMIGLVVVREDARRQGICKALMENLETHIPASCNVGLDGMPHLQEMYKKYGFTLHSHDLLAFAGKLNKTTLKEFHIVNNNYTISDFNDLDYEKLEEYDTSITTGNPRPKVLRPWLQSSKAYTLVATKSKEIVGYATLYKDDQYYKIAPLYGDTVEIIIFLFVSLLKTHIPNGVRLIMKSPINQTQVLEVAKAVGLKQEYSSNRLYKSEIVPLDLGKVGAFLSSSGTLC